MFLGLAKTVCPNCIKFFKDLLTVRKQNLEKPFWLAQWWCRMLLVFLSELLCGLAFLFFFFLINLGDIENC